MKRTHGPGNEATKTRYFAAVFLTSTGERMSGVRSQRNFSSQTPRLLIINLVCD